MPQFTDYLATAEEAQLKALAWTREASASAAAAWQKLAESLVPDAVEKTPLAGYFTPLDLHAVYDLADSVIKGQYEIARALVRVPA